MTEGEGFARKVTQDNIDEFEDRLKPSQEESQPGPTSTDGSAGTGSGSEPAESPFRGGKSIKVDVPFGQSASTDDNGASDGATEAAAEQEDETNQEDEAEGASVQPTLQVLIAEIPRSGDRWKQANFSREAYEGFFGATVGEESYVFLTHVQADGTREARVRTQGVEVASSNFRFELGAAAGLDYPDDGKPIGVFLRLAEDEFLYHLILPSDSEYPRAVGLISLHWSGASNGARRITLDAAELSRVWPSCPVLVAASGS